MNLAELLDLVAGAAPGRACVGRRGSSRTYAEVMTTADGIASVLRRRGAAHVALLDESSDDLPALLFGAATAGIPFAPLNYRLDGERLAALVARLAPAVLVVGDGMPQPAPVDGVEVVRRSAFLAEARAMPSLPQDGLDPDGIAVLLFTSGTTGEPKAAVLRHDRLTSYVLGGVDLLAAGEDDAQLVAVPPYHIAGIASILTAVFAGRRLVYLPAFDADAWCRTCEDEAITHAMVVPTMLGRVVGRLAEGAVSLASLRHLSYGGGRMPVEVVLEALRLLPAVDFVNAYGLTETSSTVAVLGPDDHRAALRPGDEDARRRLGSVGRPLPWIDLEVRDPLGRPVPPRTRGEIHVRGAQVAGEYLDRSALTADGWFPTRDAGWLDADGYLYLDGRLDDVIVRGGENLSPQEIEDVLLRHPGVAEAAVVGVPDVEWGEAVAAAVVLVDGAVVTEDELRGHVRSHLRSSKVPSRMRVVDALPYNETGKLLRRVLRDEIAGRSQMPI